MIRIGIVGCNFGRLVHLPAFRRDPRCTVNALAGRDATRTRALADAVNIPLAFGDWRELVDHAEIDAVCIAAPPELQPEIAIRALQLGKPVFAEKPMAADLAGAGAMARAADTNGCVTMLDFGFSAVAAWLKAKQLLDDGAIGKLRHVAVNWHVENHGTRMRLRNWKTLGEQGGGALGNFVSHSFHDLEWMCGPITNLSARLSGLPDDPAMETTASITMTFASGAAGSLSMSSACYLGSGHRLEFYGEDGALTLINETADYMRGFVLKHARRPATSLKQIAVDDPVDREFPADGRIAPVSRLAAGFIDAILDRTPATPGFSEGMRVQFLLDAARRAHRGGCRVETNPEAMEMRT